MRSLRFWAVTVMMIAAAVLLHVRGDVDHVPPSTPLDQLPMSFSGRTAVDIALDDEVLQVLGKGIFLNRVYSPSTFGAVRGPASEPIGLYIGYFPTQRTGQSIHSPQNCLPGAGWTFQSSGVTNLSDGAGRQYQVGEYLIAKGQDSQEVLYWYRIHGRSVANDYKAKLYTVADSIRYGRTDEALIRVTTPLAQGEDRASARARVVAFAEQMLPLLPAYIPN